MWNILKTTSILGIILTIVTSCNSSSNKIEGTLLQEEYKYIQQYLSGNYTFLHKHFDKDGIKDSLIINKPNWEEELVFFKSLDLQLKKLNTYSYSSFMVKDKLNKVYESNDQSNAIKTINVIYTGDIVEKVAIQYIEKKDLYEITYLVELDKNIGYLIEAKHAINLMYNNSFRIECFFK